MRHAPFVLLGLAGVGIALVAGLIGDSGEARRPQELFFHLPLQADERDTATPGRRVKNQNVSFTESGAFFDGRGSFLQIRKDDSDRIGTADFTVSLWARIGDDSKDNVGDLVSMSSEQRMTGFQLSVRTRSGMTSSQANFRNLFFGLNDGGTIIPEWREEGRPGAAMQIASIAVFNGDLFAGTLEFGAEGGRVYRYRAAGEWEDMKLPKVSNTVATLAEYRGRLCAGTHMYRWGSPLPGSGEDLSSGKSGQVYCWDPVTQAWSFEGMPDLSIGAAPKGTLGGVPGVSAFTVFGDQLYATSPYFYGVYRFLENAQWENIGIPIYHDLKKRTSPPARVISMGVWNGHLMAALNDSGGIAQYINGSWRNLGQRSLQNYSLSVYRGGLIVGTFDTGEVYRSVKDHEWESLGRLGREDEVMALTVYNGNLYGGTLPRGEVYRYGNKRRWDRIAELGAVDYPIGTRKRGYSDGVAQRVWNFAVYRGRLFAGTMPSGKVYSMMAGQAVSEDKSLPPGWHHIAATRRGATVELYRDGSLAASHTGEKVLDLDTEASLFIGKGAGDTFNGTMRDVRMYRRALSGREISELAAENQPTG